jgi:hypothetical protein
MQTRWVYAAGGAVTFGSLAQNAHVLQVSIAYINHFAHHCVHASSVGLSCHTSQGKGCQAPGGQAGCKHTQRHCDVLAFTCNITAC